MNILFILCGYIASALFSILFVPQLIKIIKTKKVRDLSTTVIIINILANSCNIVFGTGLYLDGLLDACLPILLGCSIAFIWSVLLLVLKIKFRENTDITYTDNMGINK